MYLMEIFNIQYMFIKIILPLCFYEVNLHNYKNVWVGVDFNSWKILNNRMIIK